jgi:hypothetical protein
MMILKRKKSHGSKKIDFGKAAYGVLPDTETG